jgi:ribosome biogenesis GTPase
MSDAPGPAVGGVGIVLASYGRGALVQSGTDTLHCGLVGRKLRLVCGDRVRWQLAAAADAPSVESVEPRVNLIQRIDSRGRPEPVAANIDRLAIVVAPEPVPDWYLVDRYWAGARHKDIEAVLIVNKSDLGLDSLEPQLEVYRRLQLPCYELSCARKQGVTALRARLGGSVTMFVGQSGVGKSSLVNFLAPEAEAQTAELTRDAEGRHTTTTARWYRLDEHSAIVDAPGVRDFAPPAQIVRAAEHGFVEIHAAAAGCRFNDCRHFDEPGCSVRSGVLTEKISARRYESYRRLARLYEELAS